MISFRILKGLVGKQYNKAQQLFNNTPKKVQFKNYKVIVHTETLYNLALTCICDSVL